MIFGVFVNVGGGFVGWGGTNLREQTILTAIWFVELEENGPSSKLLWNLF